MGSRRWIRRVALVAVAVLALSGATSIVRWGERATASAAEHPWSAVALVERPRRPSDAPAVRYSIRARDLEAARALLDELPRAMELTAHPRAGTIADKSPKG